MPRFALSASEMTLLGLALLEEARVRGLSDPEALAAAANTTTSELLSLVQTRLTAKRAVDVAALAAADAANAARKAALNTEIAVIDSILTKV